MRKLWRKIKAYCIKYRRSLRLQRWPADNSGADKWDRTKQGLERMFWKSK